MMVTAVEGRTRVRGNDLVWTSEGEGPLVLWAHGMTNDRWALERAGLYDWSPIVEAGYRLVRFDARGHGESSGTAEPETYRWDSLADDLLHLLQELSPKAPVIMMGSSMGTASAVIAATREPERFSRLVLSAAPTAWETRQNQASLYARSADLAERDGPEAFARMVAAVPTKGLFRELPDYPPQLRVSDELLPSVLRGGAESNLPDRSLVAGIQIPSLVLSWTDDPGHPVSTGEELHALLPDNEFHIADSVTEMRTWPTRVLTFLGD